MSSKLNDINVLYITMCNTKPSSAVVTNVTGTVQDMQTCANNNCFAIQVIGTVAGTEIVYLGKFQEAATATGTYADVSGGAFSTITSTTGVPAIQALNFQRTLPWLRYVGTITGTTSAVALDVLLMGQKQQL